MSSALDAFTRLQAIVNGEDLDPQTRLEYLVKKGGGGPVPTPTAADAGKVPTVGADGTVSWETPSGGEQTILYMKNFMVKDKQFYKDANRTQPYTADDFDTLASIITSNNYRCVAGNMTRYPLQAEVADDYIAVTFIKPATFDAYQSYGIWLGGGDS